MSNLKSGIILEEDETLVMEIEAELWATSSNPISVAFGKIAKFFAKLLGTKYNGFLVITNKRVVEVRNVINCYCFNTAREVKYLLPSSVKEVGYTKQATCASNAPKSIIFKSFSFTFIILKATA